jgi:hypothetical protein
MSEQIMVGDVPITVVRKSIKNLHLSVYPPTGEVRISAPAVMGIEAVQLFATTKLAWIKSSQHSLRIQEREPARHFVERESHSFWGNRYLLRVVERDATPQVYLEHSTLVLQIRPGSDIETRSEVISAWHRTQLRHRAEPLIEKWQHELGVRCNGLFIQQMKTKWGSCNATNRTIRLNTELVKKAPRCLEYVVVHELAHIEDPSHGKKFMRLLNFHMPNWPALRDQLNAAPLSHVDWTSQNA